MSQPKELAHGREAVVSVVIGSNIASMQTQRRLQESSAALSKVSQRLSSGLRINRASDDAAGLAISKSLDTDNRVYGQAVRNLNDGISLTDIADGALVELSNIVTRVRELAEQAANGTLGSSQRIALDQEAQALSKEYTRIIQSTTFNNLSLINGSVSSINLQAGYGSAASLGTSLGGTVGDGTYGASQSYTMDPGTSVAFRLGDLNGDGILDIVSTGNSGVGFVTVRLGAGDGTFKNSTQLSAGLSTAASLRLSDANNDGILDIVVGGDSGGFGSTSIHLGNGNGTFKASSSLTTNFITVQDAEVADFNGDGLADIAVGGFLAGSGKIGFFLGTGGGTFTPMTSITLNNAPYSVIKSVDLNNDGTMDIVTGGQGGNNYSLLGNGNGTFKAGVVVGSPGPTGEIAIGDLNNDGYQDMVWAVATGMGSAYVQLGRGDGTFKNSAVIIDESSGKYGVTLGDINNDGLLDMLSAGVTGSGVVTIRLGNGNGTFGASATYASEAGSSEWIAVNDLNSDGVFDIVTSGFGGGAGRATVRLGNTTAGTPSLLPFSLKTMADARQALAPLDGTMKRLSLQRGAIGAIQSRIVAATANLESQRENITAASSRISDADVATEAAELTRLNILQQASAAILSQANQQPAIALQLLKLNRN